jgi:sugar O-acyltransferase (sialic acid O-acetyltransferase NeuD family)
MIIVGAKGLAKELLQILENAKTTTDLVFFDDVNVYDPNLLYNKYPVLRTEEEVINHFRKDNRFVLGLGSPKLRFKLYNRFKAKGGELYNLIDKTTTIGSYVTLGEGLTLMSGVKVSNGVKMGKGLLGYYDSIITHDVEIGDFVELSPGCKLLGHVKIGNQVHVGAGAIILPRLIIGEAAIIGAGAVVTKHVEPYTTVLGNPAKVHKNENK